MCCFSTQFHSWMIFLILFSDFSLSLLIEFSMKMDRLWVDISFGSNDTLSLVVGCIESRSLEQQNSQQPNSIIDLLSREGEQPDSSPHTLLSPLHPLPLAPVKRNMKQSEERRKYEKCDDLKLELIVWSFENPPQFTAKISNSNFPPFSRAFARLCVLARAKRRTLLHIWMLCLENTKLSSSEIWREISQTCVIFHSPSTRRRETKLEREEWNEKFSIFPAIVIRPSSSLNWGGEIAPPPVKLMEKFLFFIWAFAARRSVCERRQVKVEQQRAQREEMRMEKHEKSHNEERKKFIFL